MDAGDLLLHVHAAQGVKLFSVRLELSEVFVLLLFLFVVLERLEDDYSAGLVTQTEKLAAVVEFYNRNNILLHNFLVGPLVAEQLIKFVVTTFAEGVFVHPIFF